MISKKDVRLKGLSVLELCAILKIISFINNVNLRELSKESGCSYTHLVALLNGKLDNPTYNTLNNITEKLGYNLKFNLTKIANS